MCREHFQDWDRAFFAGGGMRRLAELVEREGSRLPAVPESERWGAPIARPGKVVCVGLNYSDHATEAGLAIPAEPILFLKASNTVVGPNDNLLIPRGSQKTDWEVELGVVIQTEARYLDSPAAANRVYCRLLPLARCLRTGLSDGARRAMDQGQELRQLQSTRSVACDSGRDRESQGTGLEALGQWRAAPKRYDGKDDF